MLSMILKRLALAVPSLIGVVIVTFLLTRVLPGDPAAYFAGPAATKEAVEQVRVKLGLDKPLLVQFVRYVGDLSRGDLGASLTTGQPVATEIRTRLPASAELTLAGAHPGDGGRRAARHHGRDPPRLARSTMPAASSPPPACRCRSSSPACSWSMCSITCSAGRPRRSAGSTSSSARRRRSPAST